MSRTNIESLEDYQNYVDWYYECEYGDSTLAENLNPLPLLVTVNVHRIIEQSYNLDIHFTKVSHDIKRYIENCRSTQNGK